MVLAMPIYPLTPDPADVLAVMKADHENLAFGDVHVRGAYPGYFLRSLAEAGVELEITESDRETLAKNTVDFVSFSYYMSLCEAASGGVRAPRATSWAVCRTRPCLPANGDGRSTRRGCGS
jgi:6-phospho-beta-glucosidase